MRKALLVGVAGLALVGCGGSDDSGDMSLSEAFCSDLKSGLTVFQILGPAIDKGDMTADEAPDKAYGMAAVSCPEELASNFGLRGYLEGAGIDPDA